jgi:hypothetical protein
MLLMKTFRTLLFFFSMLSSIILTAFPCTKYKIDFGTETLPGNFAIGWSVNTGVNNCGYNKEEILKHRFIVTIENVFEEVLLKDTIDQSFFRTNTQISDNTPFIISIEELDDSRQRYTYLIKTQREELPPSFTKIDSLNKLLLNGYFTNAISILNEMNRHDLIDEMKIHHEILFPDNYPYDQKYFNCLLDSQTMDFIKMPIVDELSSFIKEINKLTKNEPNRSTGFKVYATITTENKLGPYTVIPSTDREKFEKVAHLLKFDNQRNKATDVLLIFGRSRNKKMFTIINERALMDQDSEYFTKTFPYRGAVH